VNEQEILFDYRLGVRREGAARTAQPLPITLTPTLRSTGHASRKENALN
jgi:hypothetical protein